MRNHTFNYYLASMPVEARLIAFKWRKNRKDFGYLNFFGFALEFKNQFVNK